VIAQAVNLLNFLKGPNQFIIPSCQRPCRWTLKECGRLNEQVRRNPKRFPDDFMFQLTEEEAESLRSHFATLKSGRGKHRKYLPYAFTEQGVAMLSSVLNSDRAIEVNVQIMRAFVKLRELIATHKDLAGSWPTWKRNMTPSSRSSLMR